MAWRGLAPSAVALALALQAGCGSSPQSRYPGYLEKQKRISSSIVITDYIVVDDLHGDTDKVDLPENRKNAQQCLNFVAGALNAKGYKVDRLLLSSVGMLMDPSRVYRVVNTPEDKDLTEEFLPVQVPPFYLDPSCTKDTLVRKLFATVYRGLINLDEENREGDVRLPAASYLGKALGAGTMVVMLVGGFNVPVAVQAGMEIPKDRPPDKKIGMVNVSQLTVRLYIIDSATGEVEWDDHAFRQGGVVHAGKVIDAVGDLTSRLP